MDTALQILYYTLQRIINFLLSVQVVSGVTVGGVLFSILLISVIITGLGFYMKRD